MNYKIVPLTSDLEESAIDALHDTFVKDEKICCCVNILTDSPVISNDKYLITKGSKNLEDLARAILKDGLSIAAVDSFTGQVLGFAINKLETKDASEGTDFFETCLTTPKDECYAAALDVVAHVEAQINFFDYYKTDCGIELFMLCVRNSAKGHGIGQRLVEETIKLAKNHEKISFVFSFFSSSFSQRAGTRAGMDTLLKIPYTEFQYKGRLFSDVTGPDHPVAVLAAIRS